MKRKFNQQPTVYDPGVQYLACASMMLMLAGSCGVKLVQRNEVSDAKFSADHHVWYVSESTDIVSCNRSLIEKSNGMLRIARGENLLEHIVERDTVSEFSITKCRSNEFLAQSKVVHHLRLFEWEPNWFKEANLAYKFTQLRSLDLSLVDIEENQIIEFIESNDLTGLAWLSLAGNPNVTYRTIELISKLTSEKRINLHWLELVGTNCDATPYIDGRRWRMTKTALKLAKKYGHQSWMMLGAKTEEACNNQILTGTQLLLPPSRSHMV